MDVTLKVIEGAKAGAKIAVKKAEFIIGRGQDCHLCAGSSAISRRHCVIRLVEQRITVQDLGSRNGTLVNGTRIEGEVELRSGDELALGPLRFLLTVTLGISSQKQTQVKTVAEAAERTASQKNAVFRDDDISDWLLGPARPAAATTETQAMTMDDTGALTLQRGAQALDVNQASKEKGAPQPQASGGEANDQSGARSPDAAPASGGASPPRPKKGPSGKLPLTSQASTKDSREAAAQALRNWNRRR